MTRSIGRTLLAICVVVLAVGVLVGVLWFRGQSGTSGHILDEALSASPVRDAASFHAADEDYFHDMDQDKNGPLALTPDEIKGRNTWIVWTAGNERLWDVIDTSSFGAVDFLKVLSSHPSQPYGRDCDTGRGAGCENRWEHFGLVNEPCFEKATGPDADRWGLWLDRRSAGCAPDPFENATKYPGVKIGSRGRMINGKMIDPGSYYGYATGVVGLRLYPNPAFDERAAARWDAKRYYTDPSYYGDKNLVKPYRVGMSCGLCHVGPNPINPPADPNHPLWANLSSNVGAQYFKVAHVLYQEADRTNFTFHLLHTSRPGALDTSFISSDNINNPRTMNAVYLLGPRLFNAKRWGKETLAGGGLNNHQFNDFLADGPIASLFEKPDTAWAPRVLKDGADSVGALGALNRVYINIGTFSEEWLTHFNPIVAGKPTSPISIDVARKNSAYFKATEAQTLDTAKFFLRSTTAHHLADAPGGQAYLTADERTLTRGKEVFAETCARCHSSKLPPSAPDIDTAAGCAGKDYLTCWNAFWKWTQTPDFKSQMRAVVMAPDFLENNYLSTELRVPVTLLETNACSPLATNALRDNIWDNFSSESYKQLPAVGPITWYHPLTGERRSYAMPAGGRGYTRPPSLVSLWSTAPFFLNNTLGRFEQSPSVEARLRSFDDAIHKLLWPQDREKDAILGDKVPGVIDRVGDRLPSAEQRPVYLKISAGYLPDPLRKTLQAQRTLFPTLFTEDGLRIGPIPPGTPIGLLSNLTLLSEDRDPIRRAAHAEKLGVLLVKILARLHKLGPTATNDQAARVFKDLVDPLLELSKCPDLVVNRGHLFGVDYSDADKTALIQFLKTF